MARLCRDGPLRRERASAMQLGVLPSPSESRHRPDTSRRSSPAPTRRGNECRFAPWCECSPRALSYQLSALSNVSCGYPLRISYPTPLLCKDVICFHKDTEGVCRQNLLIIGLSRRIFLQKELRGGFASNVSFSSRYMKSSGIGRATTETE